MDELELLTGHAVRLALAGVPGAAELACRLMERRVRIMLGEALDG